MLFFKLYGQAQELLKKYQNAHTEKDASNEITEDGTAEHKEKDASKQIDISSATETDDKQNRKRKSEGGEEEKPKIELHNLLLVTAVLIATVTYQAALKPPSTIWKKHANLSVRCISKIFHGIQKSHECPAVYYYHFMIFNTSAFCSAVFLILHITMSYEHTTSKVLATTTALLIVNYVVLILSLSPDAISALVVFAVPLTIPLAVYAVLLVLSLVLAAPIAAIVVAKEHSEKQKPWKWKSTPKMKNFRHGSTEAE